MSSPLILPKRVFLDTGHLIELSKIQRGIESHVALQPPAETVARRVILDSIRLGVVVPVISFEQVFEWCPKGHSGPGLEIAQVLDTAPLCLETTDHIFAVMGEAVAEAARLSLIPPVDLPPFLEPATMSARLAVFIRDHTPSLRADWLASEGAKVEEKWKRRGFPIEGRRFRNIAHLVKTSAQVERDQQHLSDHCRAMFALGFYQTRVRIAVERADPRAAVIERLKRVDILLELLSHLGIGTGVEALWKSFDLSRCPTIDLSSKVWLGLVAGKKRAARGDLADWTILPAYCYSDLALTENQMRHHVRAADPQYEHRVFSKATDLVRAMGL